VMSDRAFNRLAMARREAALLAGQGVDVGRAREQLAQAQAAFDTRQFDRAYELAQSAHESMIASRQRAPLASPPSAPGPATAAAAAPASPSPLPPLRAAPVAAPETPRIPKNRAESQFQLRLLDEALSRPRPGDGSAVEGAQALATQAHRSFDGGDYTEAFRLALKARRQLGEGVEALAPSPTRAPAPPPAEGPRNAPDPLRSAEAVATAQRCPSCGYPTLPDDAFCRGCGTPRTPTACPSCGAARTPTDTFCGRCGTRYG
jgi:hypothetical protein